MGDSGIGATPDDAAWTEFEADMNALAAAHGNDPDWGTDAPTGRELAESARGGSVAVLVDPGSPADSFWVAVRMHVLTGRRLTPMLLLALLATWRAERRAQRAEARLRLRAANALPRTLGSGAGPPGAVVVAQPHLTRGPNRLPSLVITEGWAGLRAPAGSAVVG